MDNGLHQEVRELIQTYINQAKRLGESNIQPKVRAALKRTENLRNQDKIKDDSSFGRQRTRASLGDISIQLMSETGIMPYYLNKTIEKDLSFQVVLS